MKLLQATIYGFGKWVEYEIDFSNQPFMAIYGENESGKTTIQRFLLFMLFGMPPKQRKFYQPKDSSKMGGRLTILDEEIGEYTIERLGDARNGAALCFTPDGREYEESWLRIRLSGMDEKTYRSIFSFSALDLNKLQEVKEEDISEVLLGIGLTGSSRIHTVEKRLEQKLGDYFKPYGKKPIINRQLATLVELQRELHVLKQEEATYRTKKNAILALEEKIELLQKKIKQQKERKYLLEKRVQALPQVEEYIQYQTRLKAYPEKVAFPEDGILRYEDSRETLLPLTSDIKVRMRNKDNFLEEKERLESENNDFPFNEANTIYSHYANYLENERDLHRIAKQMNERRNELNSKVTELNIGLNEELLAGIHLPFHLEKEWNDLKRDLEETKRNQESNKESIQLQQSEQKRMEKELQQIEGTLLPNDKRIELEKLISTHQENKLLEAIQHENIQKEKNWVKTKEETTKKIGLFLGLSLIIGIIIGVIGLLTEIPLLFNLSGISFVFGIVQWMLGKKSIKNMETMLNESSTPRTVQAVAEDDLLKAENRLRINQENIRELEFIEDKLKEASIQLRKLQDQARLLEEREASLDERKSEHIAHYPFLANVGVVYWPELYRSLKGLIQIVNHIADLQLEETGMREKLTEYHNKLDTFLQEHNFETNATAIASKIEFLGFKIDAYRDREKQILQTTRLLDDTRKQLEELNTKREIIEQEIKALFDIANVQNEEEFYQRANELKEQTDMRLASEKIATNFSSYFSKEEWGIIVSNPPKKSTLELEINEVEFEIGALEQDLERDRQQLANNIVEFQRLESSDTYSKKMHTFQMEKEKLVKLSRQWAVYKIAKDLLGETKDNYRDKYLSKVIAKTTYFFEQLTGGTYTNVIAPIGDKPFSVERVDHYHFTVQELSQGTINQLYVSLRLGISEVMSESMHLPFMIDDAFVHFDDVRNKRMISILKELSTRHQILLFTCKQEVIAEIHDNNILQLTNRHPIVEN